MKKKHGKTKKAKKTESVYDFMTRRGKETGKVILRETNPTMAPMAAGSHELNAAKMEVGIVHNKTRKKLQLSEHKKKRKRLMEGLY